MLPGGKILFKTGRNGVWTFFQAVLGSVSQPVKTEGLISLKKTPKTKTKNPNQKPHRKTHTTNKYQRVVSV